MNTNNAMTMNNEIVCNFPVSTLLMDDLGLPKVVSMQRLILERHAKTCGFTMPPQDLEPIIIWEAMIDTSDPEHAATIPCATREEAESRGIAIAVMSFRWKDGEQ